MVATGVTTPAPAEPPRLVIQVVDDAPDTLGFLVDALEAAGYGVLVARSGEAALQSLEWVIPDAILLDALMPGLDGFETCKRIKALPERAHVPIIFMTALSETAHIVAGFEAGGVDYVVKPVKIDEVLARLATHVRNARVSRLAREAMDVGGMGTLVLDAQYRIAWRSPRAADWLRQFVDLPAERLPAHLLPLVAPLRAAGSGSALLGTRGSDELRLHWIGESGLGEAMALLQVRPVADTRLREADLTRREIEVLSWLAKGKTNRDIGDILGLSPRTVNKHLEHVYAKLGVETRASAAALMTREVRCHPQADRAMDFFAPLASHPWAYPALEAVHIVGIALLLGNLVALEMRVFGFAAALPAEALARLSLGLALAGFGLAAASGLLMFATQPLELIANRFFVVKMGLLALAGCNAAWFHGRGSLRKLDALARAQMLLSTVIWLTVVVCGRWIAY